MTKVVTVTLNPSLDRTIFTHYMAVGYHNMVSDTTRLDPAGRGINISRALERLDCQTQAVVLLGNDAIGRAYDALISSEPYSVFQLRRDGLTRSNTIILDGGQSTETQLIEEGTGGTEVNLKQVAALLTKVLEDGDLIVFGGVLPEGMPLTTYAELTKAGQEMGAKVVLMMPGGFALERAIPSNPHLLALQQHEVEAFFNYPVRNQDDMLISARKLCKRGAQMVLITHESRMAVLARGEHEAWVATSPEIESPQGTTSGVEEAIPAGFLAGLIDGDSMADALKLGLAVAAYTRDQPGTEYGTREEVRQYLDLVTVEDFSTEESSASAD